MIATDQTNSTVAHRSNCFTFKWLKVNSWASPIIISEPISLVIPTVLQGIYLYYVPPRRSRLLEPSGWKSFLKEAAASIKSLHPSSVGLQDKFPKFTLNVFFKYSNSPFKVHAQFLIHCLEEVNTSYTYRIDVVIYQANLQKAAFAFNTDKYLTHSKDFYALTSLNNIFLVIVV